MGFRTATTVEALLWYYYSPIVGHPPSGYGDLTLLWLCPSYGECVFLHAAFSLSLYMRSLFLWVPASSCLCLRFWKTWAHILLLCHLPFASNLDVFKQHNLSPCSSNVCLKLYVLSPRTLPPLALHTETKRNQQLSMATFLPPFWGQNGHGPKSMRAGVLQGVYALPEAGPLSSVSSDSRQISFPSLLPSPWLH